MSSSKLSAENIAAAFYLNAVKRAKLYCYCCYRLWAERKTPQIVLLIKNEYKQQSFLLTVFSQISQAVAVSIPLIGQKPVFALLAVAAAQIIFHTAESFFIQLCLQLR